MASFKQKIKNRWKKTETKDKWAILTLLLALFLHMFPPAHETFHAIGCELTGGNVTRIDYWSRVNCEWPSTMSDHEINAAKEHTYSAPAVAIIFIMGVSYVGYAFMDKI